MINQQNLYKLPFTVVLCLGDHSFAKTYHFKAYGESKEDALTKLKEQLQVDNGMEGFQKLELLYRWSKLELVK